MDKRKIENLIKRISNNDSNAFEELYYLMKNSIFSFAFSICGDWHTSEDVLHDTFIRIKQYANTYKQNTSPKAWMLTITKHITLNKIRSDNHYSFQDSEDYINSVSEQDKTAMVENRLFLEKAFNVLNDTERQIVTLHAISEIKHSDIAIILNKPYGTVLWTYSNSLKKLKKVINEI